MIKSAWRAVAAAAALAAAFAAAPASASAAAWGEELPVSGPTTHEFSANGPAVVIDDAGNTTYVWAQTIPVGSGKDRIVRARTYRADGTVGPIRNVTEPSLPGTAFGAGAAIDGSGSVHVAWVQVQESCTPVCRFAYQVETVALDASGAPVGDPVTIVDFPLGEASLSSVRFSVGEDGTAAFGVGYYAEDAQESQIGIWKLDPAATTSVELTPDAEGPFLEPVEVAVGPEGEVFGSWGTRDPEVFLDQQVEGAFLSDEEAVEPRVLSEGLDLEQGQVMRASIDESGSAAVVFRGRPSGEQARIYVVRLDQENELSEPIPVTPLGDPVFAGSSDAMPDGTVVVSWEQGPSCYIAEVAPDGAVSAPRPVLEGERDADEPVVATDSTGHGFVLVESDSEVGGETVSSIVARPFGPGAIPAGPAVEIGFAPEDGWVETRQVAVSEGGNAAAAWSKSAWESGSEERAEAFGTLYDATPPTVSAMVPPKALAGSDVVMAASGTDLNPISYSWDFGDGGSATGPVASHSYATAGQWTVTLTATDSAGNSTTREAPIDVLDAAAGGGGAGGGGGPAVRPITAVVKAPPKRTRKRAVRVRFVASIPGSRFECALDREGWKPCASPLTLRRLKPGRHRLRIRAVAPDGLLEAGGATVSFRVQPRRPRR